MTLSDEKIRPLSHVIYKGLLDKGAITPLTDDNLIRREIKRVITEEVKIAKDIDASVQQKLRSYSKKIYEGSPEWEILYQKFFDEEAAKKGRG